MLLIAMAITVAWAASMATSLGWFDLEFWWELAALVTIMLLGHWQEMKAIGQAQGALAALAALLPDEAEVVERRCGPRRSRSATCGRRRRCWSGPAGGFRPTAIIEEGEAELDESMITGESRPVAKAPGDRVVAGTVSTDSADPGRVDAVGDDTALAGIQRLVAEAQASRQPRPGAGRPVRRMSLLRRRRSRGAHVHRLGGRWATSTRRSRSTVTVLVIACPHALGLAIPLVIALSTAVVGPQRILVKDRLALERMRTIDTVLFDKTGTLTEGRHVVTGVVGNGITDRRSAAARRPRSKPTASTRSPEPS